MRVEKFSCTIEPHVLANGVDLRVRIMADGKVFSSSRTFSRDYLEFIEDDDFKSRFSHMFRLLEEEFVRAVDHFIEEEESSHPLVRAIEKKRKP